MAKSLATMVMPESELAPAALPDFVPGQIIDDFKILYRIANGALASVYLAEQLSLGRQVALKATFTQGNEGRTIAQLDHPNIIRVYGQFRLTEKRVSVISMQYVPSISLQDLIAEIGPFPKRMLNGQRLLKLVEKKIPESSALMDYEVFRHRERTESQSYHEWVLTLGETLARALACAHAKGVLHLDIKPANILIDPNGHVFLLDFNVAVPAAELAKGQLPADFGGTRFYMSPEQSNVFSVPEGEREQALRAIDGRADVYCLCRVLRELCALGPQHSDPESLVIFERGLAKEPSHRYESAEVLADTLRGHLELARIERHLPPLGWPLETAAKYPLTSLTLFASVPQFAAGAIGYFYNSLLLDRFSSEQRELFDVLNIVYILATSIPAIVVWAGILMGLRSSLLRKSLMKPAQLRKVRAKVLRIPLWGAGMATFGWLPGVFLFPAVLWAWGHVESTSLLMELALSFVLSFVVALSYTYVIHQFCALNFLYPRLWLGEVDISAQAKVELRAISRRLHWLSLVTITVPLLSSLAFVQSSSLGANLTSAPAKALFVTLILAGTLGVWFAFSVRERIDKLLRAFGGNSL